MKQGTSLKKNTTVKIKALYGQVRCVQRKSDTISCVDGNVFKK